MKIENIDAIIFDLGGVIINLDYNLTIQSFEDLGLKDFRDTYSQMAQNKLFDDYETGKMSSQHFINKLLPFLPIGTSPNKVVSAWNAMILDVPVKKLEILKDLKNSVPIYLLSNTNEIHMQRVKMEWKKASHLPMESYFDKVFLSYEIGLRKPDKEIFEFVLNDRNLTAERTLFIDDSIQHIEGAKLLGIQTIHLAESESLYEIFS